MMVIRALYFCLFLLVNQASAQADWEFVPRCPISQSIPNFRFKNISALGVAALVNATEDIDTFLDLGCDLNYNDTYLTYIDTKCVNPIFEQLGIPCTREVKVDGFTPLILAVAYGTLATVEKLAEKPETNLNAGTSDKATALILAANYRNLKMVKILVEAGADIEIQGGKTGQTPLIVAVQKGHEDIVRYLLSKEANVNNMDRKQFTAAFYAVGRGDLNILKILKAAGADLQAVGGPSNQTLLTRAGYDKNFDPEIVDYLINQGVDVNKLDDLGNNLVIFAVIEGNLDILEALVDAGADINFQFEPNRFSALSLALLEGNIDVALFLVKNGADVNTQSTKGFTPAYIAAQKGLLSALKVLAEAGANLETAGGSYKVTPLMTATIKGELEVVKFLKESGVDLDAEDVDGNTALDFAKDYGNEEIEKLLKEK